MASHVKRKRHAAEDDLEHGLSFEMPESEQSQIIFEQDNLDCIRLTSQEEVDLAQNYSVYQIQHKRFANLGSTNAGSASPASLRSEESVFSLPSCEIPSQIYLKRHDETETQHQLLSRDAFKEFVQKYAACEWNCEKANQVYGFLNVSSYIVEPNHLLSITLSAEDNSDHTIGAILATLERKYKQQGKSYSSWNSVKDHIGEILKVYKGLEQLPDRLGDVQFAYSKAVKFHQSLKWKFKLGGQRIFRPLMKFARKLITDIHNPDEKLYENYVTTLIQMFNVAAQLFVHVHNDNLQLTMPGGKRKKTRLTVQPDIVVNHELIILVGEVKEFGSCRRICETDRDPRPVNNQADIEEHHTEGTIPTPSSSTDRRETSEMHRHEEAQGSNFSRYRSLGKQESYKVRGFLPEMLGQLLAAMQTNGQAFPLGTPCENVQLGFAVEGFKLRFVKLSLRDHLMQSDERPRVDQIFEDGRFKCDVFITQEFNLFKRSHLKMFFQILLAMCYLCDVEALA